MPPQWHLEDVPGGLPLAHVEVDVAFRDGASESADKDDAVARECLAMLRSVDNPDVLARLAVVPPLFDAERLSFFLCQLLLPNDDVDRRVHLLFSRSTSERLAFCHSAIERWAARKKGEAASRDATGTTG